MGGALDDVRRYKATSTAVSTGLGMDPKSSPSIAAKPDGTFIVAFQANTH